MSFLGSMERRFGWMAFPGIIRYYAILHVLVYGLQIINPQLGDILDFDRSRILAGEYWRLATCFFATSEFGGFHWITALFLVCMVNFMFMVSDGLESAWGALKTSFFCYFGMACVLLANFVAGLPVPYSALMVYSAAFFAFATIYPKVEVRLFLVLPVSIGFLGVVGAVSLALRCLSVPILFPFYLFVLLNYFLWAGFPALRGTARVVKAARRKSGFQAASRPEDDSFHRCAVCGRTDASHPELDFRVAPDGEERCSDHLPDS